jgi:hypothetical protein
MDIILSDHLLVFVKASFVSMPPEASGPVLAASRRRGLVHYSGQRQDWGLAIPAPATLLTNYCRDIVMDSPGTLLNISSAVFIV